MSNRREFKRIEMISLATPVRQLCKYFRDRAIHDLVTYRDKGKSLDHLINYNAAPFFNLLLENMFTSSDPSQPCVVADCFQILMKEGLTSTVARTLTYEIAQEVFHIIESTLHPDDLATLYQKNLEICNEHDLLILFTPIEVTAVSSDY